MKNFFVRIISPALRILLYLAILPLLFFLYKNLGLVIRQPELLDLGSFYAAGFAWTHRLNLYDPNLPFLHKSSDPLTGLVNTGVNANPPITAFFSSILMQFDPYTFLTGWRIFSLLLYLIMVILLFRQYRPHPLIAVWALALPGLWQTLEYGQIYIPLAFLMTIAYLAIEREGDILAGNAIGIVAAVKPNFLLILFVLIFSKSWKTIVAGAGTFLAFSVLPVVLRGPGVYWEWWGALKSMPVATSDFNASFAQLLGNVNSPWIFYGFCVLFVLVVCLWVRIRKLSTREALALGLLASFLVSPIAWIGYTSILLPLFFSRKWSLATLLSAFLLVVPPPTMRDIAAAYPSLSLLTGWWYGWGVLLLFIDTFLADVLPRFQDFKVTPALDE